MKEKIKVNKILIEICLILSLFIISIPLSAQDWEKVNDIDNSFATEYGLFGSDVAIDGNYAITKSTLALFIYKRDSITGKWFEKQVFSLSGNPYYSEGCVSISGNYIAIVSGDNEETGSVFVFERDPVTDIWAQKQVLTPSDATGFSGSIAIKGSYILAGSILEKEDEKGKNPLSNAGAVYIFENISGTWIEQQKIVETNRRENACFGSSVSISDNYIVVGSRGYYVHPETVLPIYTSKAFSGSVSVFKKDIINDYWNTEGYIWQNIDMSIIGSVCISDNWIVFGTTTYNLKSKPILYNSTVSVFNLNPLGRWIRQNSIEIFKGETPFTILRNFTKVTISGCYFEANIMGDNHYYLYKYESGNWTLREGVENQPSACCISGENLIIGYQNENNYKGIVSFYKISPYVNLSNSVVSIGSSENSTTGVNMICNTSFSATSNQSWLKVSPQSINHVIGSTVIPLILTASANPTTVSRTAKITITAKGVSNQFLFVTQKASTTINWDNPEDIEYGTALSISQLNAYANVTGTFKYTPSFETILEVGNSQPLTVNFIPDDTSGYESMSKTVIINVIKATPVISWKSPDDILYGTTLSSKQLNATSNAAGTFIYDPIAGTKLEIGTHDLNVSFTPTDILSFNPTSKTVQITVAEPSLSVNPSSIKLDRMENISIIDIKSNTSWTAFSDQEWLIVNPVSGDGNGTLTLSSATNSENSARTATVTVSGTGNLSQTIIITQSGAVISNNMNFDETDITLYPNPVNDGFQIVGIKGNVILQISDINGGIRFYKNISEDEYIPVYFLQQGIYAVRVSSGKGDILKKLVKK